jgi:hypothetical protein
METIQDSNKFFSSNIIPHLGSIDLYQKYSLFRAITIHNTTIRPAIILSNRGTSTTAEPSSLFNNNEDDDGDDDER